MKKQKKILARLEKLQTTVEAHLKPALHRFARVNVVATNAEGLALIIGALLYDPDLGLENPKLARQIAFIIREHQRLYPADYTQWKWAISHHIEQLVIPAAGQTLQVIYEMSEKKEIKL